MQAAAFLAIARRPDDEIGDRDEVAQFDQVGRHAEIAVIFGDFLAQQLDPVRGAFQPLVGPYDADIIPHETPQFVPVMGDDDFFVRIGDAAFVPWPDGRGGREVVPARHNVVGNSLAEDEAFEDRVRREPVGAVQPRLCHFACRPKARQIGTAIQIDHHAAARIMRRRHHRDRLNGAIDTEFEQPGVDHREVMLHEFSAEMRDIEQDVAEPQPLHFGVDGACHHVARRQLEPVVIAVHEARAVGQFQMAAFAARRLGDQEILDLRVEQAGRVELVEFHVRNPATGAPCHGDAVARGTIGVGRILIDAGGAAGRQHHRLADDALHLPGFDVERIDAVAAARRKAFAFDMRRGDQVDRHHAGDQRDVGMRHRRLLQRLLHRPAGGIVDMDDAAVAVAALAGQVPAFGPGFAGIERHAEFGEAVDRCRCVFDDEFDGGAVVETGTRHHRVLDMAFEGVAGFEYRGDAALRPSGRSGRDIALGEHRDLEAPGEVERGGQAGGARTDDDDIIGMSVGQEGFGQAGVGQRAISHGHGSTPGTHLQGRLPASTRRRRQAPPPPPPPAPGRRCGCACHRSASGCDRRAIRCVPPAPAARLSGRDRR